MGDGETLATCFRFQQVGNHDWAFRAHATTQARQSDWTGALQTQTSVLCLHNRVGARRLFSADSTLLTLSTNASFSRPW